MVVGSPMFPLFCINMLKAAASSAWSVIPYVYLHSAYTAWVIDMYTKEFTIKSYETATSKCPTLSTPSLVSLFSPLGTASFEASQRFIDSRGLSARNIIILSPSLTWYRKWGASLVFHWITLDPIQLARFHMVVLVEVRCRLRSHDFRETFFTHLPWN